MNKTRKDLRKVADTLKRTASNCLCTYRSAWFLYLQPHEKMGFSFADVEHFISYNK